MENKVQKNVVHWKMHVAPIIKLHQEGASIKESIQYILDPSVSPMPIPRDQWYRKITNNKPDSITGYVTCERGTYSSFRSYCFNPNKNGVLNADEKGVERPIKDVMEKELQVWLAG